MDLIAINTIHRAVKEGKAATRDTPAVPPKTEIIRPGETFTANAEEGQELIDQGAARKDNGDKPKTKNTRTDSTNAVQQQLENGAPKAVDDMTKEQITSELNTLGVQFDGRSSKDDLAKLLEDSRSENMV